jgi:hypothetical protein
MKRSDSSYRLTDKLDDIASGKRPEIEKRVKNALSTGSHQDYEAFVSLHRTYIVESVWFVEVFI